MSSLPLGGDFIKFATKNHCLPSVDGPRPVFYCASTGYFAAPQNTHSCIPVKPFDLFVVREKYGFAQF